MALAAWFMGLVVLIWALGAEVRAGVAFEVDHPAAPSVQLGQQHVAQLFQEKL